jgi:probable phosphoglycerate mutase
MRGAQDVTIDKHLIRWPARLWIVRHGESAGNVARDAALRTGAARIGIKGRDVDVPLSLLGEQQSDALGRWFADRRSRPDIVLSSPYRRARDTAERVVSALRPMERVPMSVDERLREKEFGVIDGLTRTGIEQIYPDVAAHRAILGKFYHRPPGGESWCDVTLRLRSMLDTLSLHYAGRSVVVITHQVVVLCLRYLLEGLDEARTLAIDRAGDIANCGVTEYRLEKEEGLVLRRYNHVAPMTREGTAVTAEPDKKATAP